MTLMRREIRRAAQPGPSLLGIGKLRTHLMVVLVSVQAHSAILFSVGVCHTSKSLSPSEEKRGRIEGWKFARERLAEHSYNICAYITTSVFIFGSLSIPYVFSILSTLCTTLFSYY